MTTLMPSEAPTLTVQGLQERIEKKTPLLLLDVREPDEYAQDHIPDSTLMPVKSVPDNLSKLPKDKPLIVYCRSGKRSARVATYLQMLGFTNVLSLDGGFLAWSARQSQNAAGFAR